ncbi:hypothetical protein Cpha266_1124 [Chlorobium phaeobacteroides DSM 266]|uniref:Uncharacterized protein n=1 Tax=Chlorobium phaeobacteroides (strain DSM 266 / SMG 266 / 2430) TaxID=290317 RepID=A1BFI7_CHLPD|nr:hypothetical protein Cpha266_1124 [Chlorobium phaeobacteroides DSM 266]
MGNSPSSSEYFLPRPTYPEVRASQQPSVPYRLTEKGGKLPAPFISEHQVNRAARHHSLAVFPEAWCILKTVGVNRKRVGIIFRITRRFYRR